MCSSLFQPQEGTITIQTPAAFSELEERKSLDINILQLAKSKCQSHQLLSIVCLPPWLGSASGVVNVILQARNVNDVMTFLRQLPSFHTRKSDKFRAAEKTKGQWCPGLLSPPPAVHFLFYSTPILPSACGGSSDGRKGAGLQGGTLIWPFLHVQKVEADCVTAEKKLMNRNKHEKMRRYGSLSSVFITPPPPPLV